MARIRSIKPEFFRHRLLQQLMAKHPTLHLMLVFAALWGHCDKAGSFLWRTPELKLDILPFTEYDLDQSLDILVRERLLLRYSVRGVEYGFIPTFGTHQRLNGKEAADPARFPPPPKKRRGSKRAAPGKHRGSTGAAPEQQRGTQGREGNAEGKGITTARTRTRPRLAVDNSKKGARQEDDAVQPQAQQQPRSRSEGRNRNNQGKAA